MRKRRNIILLALLILLALTALLCYRNFMPHAKDGQKTISVTVDPGDGSVSVYDITTQGETLADALRQANAVGEIADGFVSTVAGVTANAANEEWWCLTKDGEMLMTGVNDTMIADGDQYEFTLTVGYDW